MSGIVRYIASALAVAGCASPIAVESPSSVKRGEALVFGRVRVVRGTGDVDWSSFDLLRPDFDVVVQRAGSREGISYKLGGDGSFAWTLPPGEHAVIGFSWGDLSGPTLALVRVPHGEDVVYAGTLVIRFVKGTVYEFGVEDDELSATRALQTRWPATGARVARSLFQLEVAR